MVHIHLPEQYVIVESLFPFTFAELKPGILDDLLKQTCYFCGDCWAWVEGFPLEFELIEIGEWGLRGRSFRCHKCRGYMGFMVLSAVAPMIESP